MFEGHPHLLAEMYAYSVASAHLEVRGETEAAQPGCMT